MEFILKVVVIKTWRMAEVKKEAWRERREGCVQDFGRCPNLWNRRRIRIQQNKQKSHLRRDQEIELSQLLL